MTHDEATALATHWIESWNARDVEAVLGYFDPNVRFTSPRALALTGRALVEGKDALRSYWQGALARIETIRFTLDYVLWDTDRRTMSIVYEADINGQRLRACEFLRFGEGKRAVEGEAMHGAAL